MHVTARAVVTVFSFCAGRKVGSDNRNPFQTFGIVSCVLCMYVQGSTENQFY